MEWVLSISITVLDGPADKEKRRRRGFASNFSASKT
jgi:hypothetical protein